MAIISGRAFSKKEGELRQKLVSRIKRNGFEHVMRAHAYTWSNRFVALRYMELHGYLEHGYRVLSNAGQSEIPEILEHAADVTFPGLNKDKVIEVRLSGNWEAWLDFFAEAVVVTANQAVDTIRQLTDLSNGDRDKISGLGRAAASTLQVHRALLERPIATASWLVKKTTISPATVNKCLNHLESLGIVQELTGRKRNRLYSYTRYIEIMNYGTGLPDERGQNNL